jgi:hypothetical protein
MSKMEAVPRICKALLYSDVIPRLARRDGPIYQASVVLSP